MTDSGTDLVEVSIPTPRTTASPSEESAHAMQSAAPMPAARGPLGRAVLPLLTRPPEAASASTPTDWAELDVESRSVRGDADLQLVLWALYELHYRGLVGVDPRWAWHPAQLTLRARLESAFEAELREAVAEPVHAFTRSLHAGGVLEAYAAVERALPGASVSRFAQGAMTAPQWREWLVCKSIYQLKEADPHSWAIPRLSGDVLSALIDIQYDEYGAGQTGRQHRQLFEQTLRASGLDDSYAAYVDLVPVEVLALNNFMTMIGVQPHLLGACLGQLALYEATSCLPNKHAAAGGRRLGVPESGVAYFDEHVEADAIHEQIALQHLVGGYLRDRPADAATVGWGVAAGTLLDNELGAHQLAGWRDGTGPVLAGEL